MLSEYDIANVHDIMAGRGDWFTAQLLRLINSAGGQAKSQFELAFPAHVELVRWWYDNRADAPAPLHLADRY